jgi:hypothetical protein
MSARSASEAPFPYGWPGKVCYFALDPLNFALTSVRDRDGMRAAVRAALAGDVEIFAAWPGQYRTDLFHIDQPQRLAEAIGVLGEAAS